MTKPISLLLFAVLCCGGSIFAQGSGSTEDSGNSEKQESPFTVTKVVKGKVLKPVSNHELVLEVDGHQMSLRITESVEIVAEDGVKVENPDRVKVADLKRGQTVRVKYRAADKTAVEVRILKITT